MYVVDGWMGPCGWTPLSFSHFLTYSPPHVHNPPLTLQSRMLLTNSGVCLFFCYKNSSPDTGEDSLCNSRTHQQGPWRGLLKGLEPGPCESSISNHSATCILLSSYRATHTTKWWDQNHYVMNYTDKELTFYTLYMWPLVESFMTNTSCLA